VLPNNIMLLVTTKKFEINPMLVNANKPKPHKYMESEVQKQEHMLIYWEKSVGDTLRSSLIDSNVNPR
jgi:hypothetical protein